MKRLVLLFVSSLALGLAGLYLATRDAFLDPRAYVPVTGTWVHGAALLLCLFVIWILPLVKLRDLARWHGFAVRPHQALLAHVASVFGVAMTPSGTGGGPGMMMALHRFGVPAGTALGIAVQTFVLDLIVFAVLIPLGVAYLYLAGAAAVPWRLETTALVAALAGGAVALVLLRRPRALVRVLLGAAASPWTSRFAIRLRGAAREYYRGARAFGGMTWGLWSKLLGITVVTWVANFVLFWLLLRLYGVDVALLAIVATLAALSLISFVIPTPGASGFMELVVGLAMEGGVDAGRVAAPILLWRFGTFYIVYLLGPLSTWAILLERPPRWMERLARLRR